MEKNQDSSSDLFFMKFQPDRKINDHEKNTFLAVVMMFIIYL